MKNLKKLFIAKVVYMSKLVTYGINYPFTNNGWCGNYLDLNENEIDYIKSEILHIAFTPKGQRLRMPEFGSDLIKYIFNPNESDNWDEMKGDIREQISKYLPNVVFDNINIFKDETNDNKLYAVISFSIKKGNNNEEHKITLPIT